MKIRKLETFSNEFVGFVRVTADTGHQGWGQVSTYNADITGRGLPPPGGAARAGHGCAGFRGHAGDHQRARAQISGLLSPPRHDGPRHGTPGSSRQDRGKARHRALGGTPGKLRAYASSMKRDITPKDEARRLCKLRDEKGFDAFKWRVGAECGRDRDEWPGRTEEIVPTVSRALGDGVAKLVDANSCYSPKRAIEVGGCWKRKASDISRSPAPIGNSRRRRKWRMRCRST
jgi:L-alanine-DL-glutamate epimerase-like enolase superfamily enzyme